MPDGGAAAPRAALAERLGELTDLAHTGLLLGWDQQTMMPPGGSAARGEAIATLDRLTHARLTDPALGALLEAAVSSGDETEAAVARVVLEDHEHALRVPPDLVAELARAGVAGQAAWLKAREANDARLFLPALARNVALRRELAACFPEAAHPYDALLHDFEPGLTTARVREVFGQLREGLVPLIAAFAERPAPPPLNGPFDPDVQRALALRIAASFGFDAAEWRLDESAHPFALRIGAGDIRVVGRFQPHTLTGVFAVMHEVGHGIYEAQIDPALDRTTTAGGTSLGLHESQSRLWENLVGRSRPFWERWWPELQASFPDALAGFDLDTFHRSINAVQPSPIRVEADEATYSLHIVLRFELEVALIEGSLAVEDLPGAWAEGTRELLGIEVADDRDGVLQDIHWAYGELGYFPTYALGNIIGSQLWEAVRVAVPDLDARIAAGDVAPLRAWLREHVHRFGRTRRPAEILRDATGSDLDAGPFLHYLRTELGALHGL